MDSILDIAGAAGDSYNNDDAKQVVIVILDAYTNMKTNSWRSSTVRSALGS